MKYIPLTDEQLENNVLERIEAALEALSSLNDDYIPDKLLEALEATVESWGEWEQIVLEDDYSLYLDYCDEHRKEVL
jgi:hypothetical protein